MSRLFGTVELGIIAHWQLPADVFSDTSKQQSNLSEPQLLLRCITYGPAESGIETALRNVLTCMVDSRLICGSRLCALSHLRVWTSKTRQHDPTSTIIPKTVLVAILHYVQLMAVNQTGRRAGPSDELWKCGIRQAALVAAARNTRNSPTAPAAAMPAATP